MSWDQIIKDREFTFHRISSLIILMFAAFSIFPIIESVVPFIWLRVVIWLSLELFIIISWFYVRTVFPKGEKGKQNLVVAITTEDIKQKTRLTNDFANEIEKQLSRYGLANSYGVIVLHNHLSKSIREMISLRFQTIAAGLSGSESDIKFEKAKKRLNAKFFVYGDLIKRNTSNSTYCFSIEALILHSPITLAQSDVLRKEFNEHWKREVKFLEDDELNGFKNNAEYISFSATYMIGLATFIDNNFEHGITIWESLEKHTNSNKDLKAFQPRMTDLKAISYFLLSRKLYSEGHIEESMIYRKKYLKISPNEYDKRLVDAINLITKGHPREALEHIEKAKDLSNGDGGWIYSKLYLHIYMKELEIALEVLDEILANDYKNEPDTVGQVLSYNESRLDRDKAHVQTEFIVGVLMFKKLGNPMEAYERIEKFIVLTKGDETWKPLYNRAKEYIGEIDEIIKFK